MTNLNVTLSRRGLFKTIPIAAAVPSAASMFITGAAKAQEAEETGFTICDNCNQMPMCGIKFQKQGNTIVSVGNWKEHQQKLLCNKALATLQRLYNPNRLLYPMKRTNPKGSDDPGFVRCSWEEALGMIAANLKAIRENMAQNPFFSSAVILRSLVPLSCAWPVISVLGTMLLNPPLLAVKAPCLLKN